MKKKFQLFWAQPKLEKLSQPSKLYIRTPLTLISPGWTSKLAGADGSIFVYEISDPISKIILLDGGKMKHVALEGI